MDNKVFSFKIKDKFLSRTAYGFCYDRLKFIVAWDDDMEMWSCFQWNDFLEKFFCVYSSESLAKCKAYCKRIISNFKG